jgi:hypothetical protein
MSKSSNAVARCIFGWCMRNAASILFLMALALFLLTIASYATLLLRPEGYQTDTPTTANLLLNVLAESLDNAVWPFIGSALIWTLQNRLMEAAE